LAARTICNADAAQQHLGVLARYVAASAKTRLVTAGQKIKDSKIYITELKIAIHPQFSILDFLNHARAS